MFNLISPRAKKIVEKLLIAYFLFVCLYLKNAPFSILFCLIPFVFLLSLFIFLRKQEENRLLSQLYSLLIPLESQMKSGLSFINAWQKGLEDLPEGKIKDKLQKVTEILKFQKAFSHQNKNIENLVADFALIHQSASPLKRLNQLQRKIKVERSFHIKSERTLFQTRMQVCLLSLFYFGLLSWTILSYGKKYSHLILFSLLLFSIGFFWIIQTGRKMKWTI